MASIRRLGEKWRAEVYRKGQRKSKVFPTRREAREWAARVEFELDNPQEVAADATLGDLLDRYRREVTPGKRGRRSEEIRIERLKRDPISRMKLGRLTPDVFSAWRDDRLRVVGPATVRREMGFLSSVLNTARREWGMLADNPLSEVRRPSSPPPRDRLPTDAEIAALRAAAGDDLERLTARALHAFLFALETAMRAGEICSLRWDDVDLDRRVARLRETKNGRPRDVPLSTEAVRLLRELPRRDPVFGLTPRQLDALWRALRRKAGVSGLTFHDSRHAAITRLARKLDVLALARMVGHSDLRMLQVYYNETAEELARRLD
ncbi:phage integrase family protein [Albidovulum inexpectatum]|uniref:Phage integrase family protein n=1 Tax=Albidovulum inexpectatum TaxID=196587 RepID=A0A2S5JEF4_9RHOB|nr:site-specific integrase [Albidovulum inexpectatum]PPB79801.1 phage integrase family protein [Albidovulum inexpectatum]